jgi:hypothetical protein
LRAHPFKDHSQRDLTALLELLVDHTRPPLVISRLAGDAVISYGLEEDFAGGAGTAGLTSTPALKLTAVPLPKRIIEDTYVTFRAALDRLVLNNNCGCNACANIAGLDLKFFVHFGTFGIQNIKDHVELVGSEVNLLHRLLKNTVTETTGYRAYALYTDAAVRQLEIADPAAGMTKISTLPTGPFFGVLVARLTTPMFTRFLNQALEQFKQVVEADYRERKV